MKEKDRKSSKNARGKDPAHASSTHHAHVCVHDQHRTFACVQVPFAQGVRHGLSRVPSHTDGPAASRTCAHAVQRQAWAQEVCERQACAQQANTLGRLSSARCLEQGVPPPWASCTTFRQRTPWLGSALPPTWAACRCHLGNVPPFFGWHSSSFCTTITSRHPSIGHICQLSHLIISL